jgi:hypothetical protein
MNLFLHIKTQHKLFLKDMKERLEIEQKHGATLSQLLQKFL